MKSQLFWMVILTALFSCKSKKDNFNYDTTIASLTYKAELNYLNRTIVYYSTLADTGNYIRKQDSILEKNIEELKIQFNKDGKISSLNKDSFFTYFENVLKSDSVYSDLENLKELKSIPIYRFSDIDLLRLYLKRSLVSKLTDNKLLPFNTWSIMATVDKWKIKDGEEFIMQMNTTAFNSRQPAEWFIVKDGSKDLTKDNISDTLYPGEFGETTFKTKQYHKGENQIPIYVRIKTTHGEQIIGKMIVYTVE